MASGTNGNGNGRAAAVGRERGVLVVGGGMAGISAAIEAAEAGSDVYVVEQGPSLGGRVAQLHQYFPKLCPPYCGLEINFRRIRSDHRHFKVFTLASLEGVSGSVGDYEATIRLDPRYVIADRCIACNRCAEVCPVERPNAFNYGLDTTKAAYLPNSMAFPMKYVIDGGACVGAACNQCAEVCPTDAIDLSMTAKTVTLKVGAIVLATGWKPYDANRLTILGFAEHRDVVSNVQFERLAAVDGPTCGRIVRPSDGREAKRVAFVQCAGSRDVNHLPYCSSICCLSSIKEATYVRTQYPDSEVFVFYIDIRAPGRNEDFYHRIRADEGVHFIKGKVAKVLADPAGTGDLVVEADDMLSGAKRRVNVDMVVLATGMQPSLAGAAPIPGLPVEFDEYGFALENRAAGVFVAGVAHRPADVVTTVRDATGAALKAIHATV
ncbi:MAG TPA: CoB--CoM heterodisulfide reductase iron-sulfur subunit A family protein [Acidimicrobiia bacterium]|nr:CoB--CoM heterodisulfide reductase iron-sulfur subunit A family protein [Acidimicrobiia bacterium]